MKFENLPLSSQIIVLEQFGERVGLIEAQGRETALYLLNDFYVEVIYKGYTRIIERIDRVAGGERLARYCPEPEW
jgi:hypothetical protein